MDPLLFLQVFVRGKRIAEHEHARWLAVQNAWFSWAKQRSRPLDLDSPDSWPMVRRRLTEIADVELTIGLRGQIAYLSAQDPAPLRVSFAIRPTSRTRRLIPFGCEALWDGYDLLTRDSRAARQVIGADLRATVKRLACGNALVYRAGTAELSWPASRLDAISSGAAAEVLLATLRRGSDEPYR